MKHLLRSFFFSAPFVLCACLVTSSTLFVSGTAKAQGPPPPWSMVVPTPFTGQIHIVKFNDSTVRDASGAPDTGFVSDGPEIWFTGTGGKTKPDWKLATINGAGPTPVFSSGWVNDISFKDDLHGVAIIQGNTNPVDHGVLITSDGGATWIFDDSPGTPDSGSGIYWNPSNGYIFAAGLDKGFVYSSDGGTTWNVIDTNKYYTGFAFANGTHGIVSTMGSNPFGYLPTNFWKYTTDGGLTWDTSHMLYESWQPVAIATTQTFFAASDNYISANNSSIFRSDNGGYSFVPVLAPPTPEDPLNQSMQGDGCSLFAASTNAATGMWYSISDGTSWQPMPPTPPNPPINTRFYVSPTTIWSFTSKVLMYISRVATPDIHMWPSTLKFTNANCNIPTDTIVHIFGCNCSNNDSLISTGVTQTQTQDQLTVTQGTVPRPLCTTGMMPFGTQDAVTISYKPTTAPNDTGSVDLKFSQNGSRYDTTIPIIGNGAMPTLSVPTQRIVLYSPACGDCVDTTITITNTGCVPITIVQTITPSDNYCVLHFDTLQTTLGSNNPSQQFHIHFCPSLQAVSDLGGIQFKWTSDGGVTYHTTKLLEVVANTTTTIQPSFRGFHIGFVPGHPRDCCDIPTDTTIYFINTTCDTLKLSQPNIFGSTNPNVFKFNNAKPPIVFPVTIPPGQFIPLGVHINCHQGVDSEKVEFTYTVGTTGSDCSSILTAKDTASLAFKSSGPIIPASVSPKSLSFLPSCCDSTQIKTFTIITGCKYDTLIGDTLIDIPTKGHFFLDPPPTPPIPLDTAAGRNRVQIPVHFWPSSGNTDNGSVVLTFSSGLTITYPLTGSCTSQATASLSSDRLDFGLLACNQSACDSVWIKNGSCSSILIQSIQEPGVPFTLDTTGIQLQLGQGDSTKVHLCVTPNASTGASDMAVFKISSLNGAIGIPDTLNFTASFTPPLPADSITQLAGVTICDTSTLDESFTLVNIGQCYTYVITGASATNANNVTVTPVIGSYPLHIGVGEKQIFSVHFDPKGQAKNLTGNITLIDSAGNSITVPYDITVDSCNTAGHFVLTLPGNTITTPNCTTGKLVFTAGAGGGAGVVTGVTVSGSTRFAATTPTTGAMPFTDTITFDPNLVGGNSATLNIQYTINGVPGGDTTIPITGVVTGSKFKATVNVASETVGAVKPNDTMMKDFEVVLQDTVFDSLDMNKLSLLIRFDGDLLFKPNYLQLDTGWTVDAAHTYQDKQGLHLTLLYSGTSKHFTGFNDTILKVAFLAAVSDSNGTVAYADSAHFNDSTFEACTLKALNGSGTAPFSIDTSCSTAIIERALPDNLQPYTGIEVIPNPAHKDGSGATLHFTSNVSVPMTVDVLNVLGNSVAQLANGPVEKGDHALAIPTNEMPEGAYFVRISANGYTVVRKFVLEKE